MSIERWAYWHRPQGGWWVIVPDESNTVIGYVSATQDIEEGWVAFPTWTGGLAAMVGPWHARPAAGRALYERWLADPDRNAPEVPAP